MEDLEAVDNTDEFFLESARGAIWASACAEDFLAGARFAFSMGIEDDVAGSRLGI